MGWMGNEEGMGSCGCMGFVASSTCVQGYHERCVCSLCFEAFLFVVKLHRL